MSFCGNCGNTLKETDNVCGQCGTVIKSNIEPILEETVEAVQEETVGVVKEETIEVVQEETVEAVQEETVEAVQEETVEVVQEETVEAVQEETVETVQEEKVSEVDNNPVVKEKKVKPKSLIIGAIILVILIVGGVGAKFLFKGSSPEKIVEKFRDAVIAEDISTLKGILESKDNRLEMNDENIKILTDYYKNNPSRVSNDIDELYEQVYTRKSSEMNPVNLLVDEDGFIKKHKISVSPRFITIKNAEKDLNFDLTINGKKLEKDKLGKEIGPLMPGEYKIKATIANEIAPYEEEVEVDLFYEEDVVDADILRSVYKVEIKSNIKKATLYIDGKSTGKTFEEIKEPLMIKEGTELHGVVKNAGKDVVSNKRSVYYGGKVEVDFSEYLIKSDDAYKEDIIDVAEDYASDFAYAVNYNDFSYIEEYLYPDSELYKSQEAIIKTLNEQGVRESFVSIDVEIKDYDENTKTGNITTKEVYEIKKDDKETEETYNNEYGFKYNEEKNKYMLTSIKVNVK